MAVNDAEEVSVPRTPGFTSADCKRLASITTGTDKVKKDHPQTVILLSDASTSSQPSAHRPLPFKLNKSSATEPIT